ncbi:MAG: helix-turn-helix domain-containing protein [Acidimicrobiales bacterium]
MEQYLSRGEAARRLGVPPRTVQEWARHGKLPCIRTLGGHRRFSPSDVDAISEMAKTHRVRTRTRRQVSP